LYRADYIAERLGYLPVFKSGGEPTGDFPMPDLISDHSPLNLKSNHVLSRRRFGALAGIGAFSASFSLFFRNAAVAQEGKASKATAKYQDQPNDGHSCAICQFFHAPHTCQLVEGDVSLNGWCSYWSKKV
jgi:hypothetical protein